MYVKFGSFVLFGFVFHGQGWQLSFREPWSEALQPWFVSSVARFQDVTSLKLQRGAKPWTPGELPNAGDGSRNAGPLRPRLRLSVFYEAGKTQLDQRIFLKYLREAQNTRPRGPPPACTG